VYKRGAWLPPGSLARTSSSGSSGPARLALPFRPNRRWGSPVGVASLVTMAPVSMETKY
jgi:hypothetical protein